MEEMDLTSEQNISIFVSQHGMKNLGCDIFKGSSSYYFQNINVRKNFKAILAEINKRE